MLLLTNISRGQIMLFSWEIPIKMVDLLIGDVSLIEVRWLISDGLLLPSFVIMES